MVIEDTTVVRTGQEHDLDVIRRPGDRVVDVGGGFVVPGFDDCHMHVLSLGMSLGQVNVRPDVAPTFGALQARVAERAAEVGPGSWILGRGYNQNLLAERRHPTRLDLDAAAPVNPVVLWHTSGHVLAANSAALNAAGISSSTADPPGGQIDRQADGNPTGVLKETAMPLLTGLIPPPTADQTRQAILDASAALAREGITSASDAATGHDLGLEAEVEAYRAALDSDRMKTRISVMPLAQQVVPEAGSPVALAPSDVDAGSRPEWLRIGHVKIFSDGALTTRTAAMREPYIQAGETGILTWSPEQLAEIVRSAHANGWRIATHAIGDRAIESVLDAYESIGDQGADPRHRIEHCSICDADLIARMKALDVVPVLQPEDIAVLGDAYPSSVGPQRANNNSPVRWFENAGLSIAFSSDRPVTLGHPLAGIRAAVERRTASGVVLGEEHRVSAETAIGYYTAGAAFASGCDGFRGKLIAAQRADFVVLDRDITRCDPQEITAAKVLMTVVGGQTVFER
jgi:hypothetical protein